MDSHEKGIQYGNWRREVEASKLKMAIKACNFILFVNLFIFFFRTVIRNGQATTFTLKIETPSIVTPAKTSSKGVTPSEKTVMVDVTDNMSKMTG